MKTLLKILTLTLLSLTSAQAENGILDSIGKIIINNNAQQLCNFVDENIDITLVDEDQTYSKDQATLVLAEFFKKNTVHRFEVLHKGSSGNNAEFAIAKVDTSTTSFRTYILINKINDIYKLIELRFEEE